jgi:hypothetical protein
MDEFPKKVAWPLIVPTTVTTAGSTACTTVVIVVSISEFEKLKMDGIVDGGDEEVGVSSTRVEFLSIVFKVIRLPPIAPKNELPNATNIMIRKYKIFFGSIIKNFTFFLLYEHLNKRGWTSVIRQAHAYPKTEPQINEMIPTIL